ncbi:MAG: DEAD/DEAH box helicase [Steroidobacter sp.]
MRKDSDASPDSPPAFRELNLSEAVLKAIEAVGYESPSPIQAATIPHLLAGKDVVGQAQTGTGKTAAFALPILSRIDVREPSPQALVLVPTRELAIQVAEAFQRYASHLEGFHVLPIYGGQSYTPQLQSLRRGVHVVVGTPGRIMDHMKRETLKLGALKHLVLDEADEMLRMGFIDDVEWILEKAPKERQVALFSATMPAQIRRIAQHHLRSPAEVTIKSKTTTASKIRQRYWIVSGMHKLDALTRILEAEAFDGMLVFTRTKIATEELAERLGARGFAVEALNGDIVQAQRERTVARLKAGQIDIVVATDVAARGLDVERVSHVVNFDVPYDPESYVHRIGRTGRAGRSGEAILFIAPRERNMLRVIERATRQPIEPMQLPTIEDVNEQRVSRFNQRITEALAAGEADTFRSLIERYESEYNVAAVDIAAALASIAQGKKPLLMDVGGEFRRESRSPRPEADANVGNARPPRRSAERPAPTSAGERQRAKLARPERAAAPATRGDRAPAFPGRKAEPDLAARDEPVRERPAGKHRKPAEERATRGERSDRPAAERRTQSDADMETYRVEVGLVHGVKPGNIVGAIANEAGLDGKHIGRVVIRDDHSFVDLPGDMPKEIFRQLQKVRVAGQKLEISRALKTQTEKLHRERAPSGRKDARARR